MRVTLEKGNVHLRRNSPSKNYLEQGIFIALDKVMMQTGAVPFHTGAMHSECHSPTIDLLHIQTGFPPPTIWEERTGL